MMRGWLHRIIKRPGRYPVKRDVWGRSARRRAFDRFDRGERPSQVASKVGISARTAYRYYQSWKKYPRNLELWYMLMKSARKARRVCPEGFAQSLSEVLGVAPERVTEELEKPWGLKRLLSGKLKAMEKKASLRRTLMRWGEALEQVRVEEARSVKSDMILKAIAQLEQENQPNDYPPVERGFVIK